MLGVFDGDADEFMYHSAGEAYDQIKDAGVYTISATQDVVVVKAPPMQGAGFYLLRMKNGKWGVNGQNVGNALSHISYDDLRIAAGYPRFPNEVGEDYIPLETGLLDAISFNKGCYIGQEIIARMESRGQIAKRLVMLDVSFGDARTGDEIRAGGDAIGKLTSLQSARYEGHRYGLGYVRAAFAVPDREVHIGSARARIVAPVQIGEMPVAL
jgi:aminomethyltransferase